MCRCLEWLRALWRGPHCLNISFLLGCSPSLSSSLCLPHSLFAWQTPPFAESAFSFDIPEVEQAKGSNRFTPSYRSYIIVWSTSLNQYFKGKEEPSQCSRRYKDFLWLRTQLVEQFPGIIVPPVPPKSLSSAMAKFTVIKDEEVVLYRQRALLKFLNRVAAIPVLAESSLFQVRMLSLS